MEPVLIICNLLSGAAWFMWAALRYVGLLRVILVACYLKLLDLSEWLHVICGCLLMCEWSAGWSYLVCVSGFILCGAALYSLIGLLLGTTWFVWVALYYLEMVYFIWVVSSYLELLHLIWSSSAYLELLHVCLICILSEMINLRGFVLSGAVSYLSEWPIMGADWFCVTSCYLDLFHIIWVAYISCGP
jgi:hypothetical protein